MSLSVRRHGIAVALLVLGACAGTDEVVTLQNPTQALLLDDSAPPEPTVRDPALDYVNRRGFPANHSLDRYRFDVAAFRDDGEKADAAKLFPSHAAHLAAHPSAIPSVQTIGTYTKQLDDTIYAGIERAAQDGLAPTVLPKRTLLSESLGWLAAHRSAGADQAIAQLGAAFELGGDVQASIPADLRAATDSVKSGFLLDASHSKPFGFYTWSAELRAIWQQDRLLQQPLSGPAGCALAAAIGADPAREERSLALVGLYSRLTNPLHSSLVDLLPIAGDASCAAKPPHAFLSTSETVEVALFEKLYPNGVPAGANLMQDLVDAIRKGSVSLAPTAGDGWYQYQEYALETLLVTDKSEERAKIAFMGSYKKRLQEAFETMLVQHRETHAKQADGATATAAPAPPPTPDFRVEPLATVYVRHARSYVFLESALDAAYGPALLDAGVATGPSGPEGETLRARLRRTRDLFFGLYLVACQDVGLSPTLASAGDPAAADWSALASQADAWLLKLASDPVAASDVRVMIPIASLDGGRARYWAVIGVRTTLAGYSFLSGSDVSAPADPAQMARVPLPTEQFVEVTSSDTPLSRDEFRALCDQAQTADAIVAALEAR